MSIATLSTIGLAIGIVGFILVCAISVCAYFHMKHGFSSGKYAIYIGSKLSDTDCTDDIHKAVQYLRIINDT